MHPASAALGARCWRVISKAPFPPHWEGTEDMKICTPRIPGLTLYSHSCISQKSDKQVFKRLVSMGLCCTGSFQISPPTTLTCRRLCCPQTWICPIHTSNQRQQAQLKWTRGSGISQSPAGAPPSPQQEPLPVPESREASSSRNSARSCNQHCLTLPMVTSEPHPSRCPCRAGR